MYLYIYNDYVCQQLRTFTELAGAKTDLYRFEKAYVLRPDQELHQGQTPKAEGSYAGTRIPGADQIGGLL